MRDGVWTGFPEASMNPPIRIPSGIVLRAILPCSALALALLSSGASAATTYVGSPSNPGALPAALVSAYNSGARDITINPGSYAMTSTGGVVLNLNGWSNAKVTATNCTFTFVDVASGHTPVALTSCTGVTFQGGVYRFTTPAFTQGRISNLGLDSNHHAVCDWTIDAGYPNAQANIGFGDLNVVDQSTRLLKVGAGDFAPASETQTATGVFHLTFNSSSVPFANQDWLVGRSKVGGSFIFHLNNARNCTLSGVNCQYGGFATYREEGNLGGGNHYLNCQISLGPKLTGMTEAPLVGCGADGIHATGANPGPDMEGCIFQGVFLDDCIAMHGNYQNMVSASGNTIVFSPGYADFRVGQPVRLSNTAGFFTQANCTAIQNLGGSANNVQVTLDRDVNAPAGTQGSNPNFACPGYKVINCQIGNTRSRGMLLKGDNGLVQGCLIQGCVQAGVSIGPEPWAGEADYVWNSAVKDNVFQENGKDGNTSALLIHGDKAMGNENLTLTGNSFVSNYGAYALEVQWTNGATIEDNTFTNPASSDLTSAGSLIFTANDQSIANSGNHLRYEAEDLTVTASSGQTERLLGFDPNLSGDDGAYYASAAVGNYVTFRAPSIVPGSYTVSVGLRKYVTRGIWQLKIGRADNFAGTAMNIGAPQDEYAATTTYAEAALGSWAPASAASDKWFQFTITGKNASSSGFDEAFDYIELTQP